MLVKAFLNLSDDVDCEVYADKAAEFLFNASNDDKARFKLVEQLDDLFLILLVKAKHRRSVLEYTYNELHKFIRKLPISDLTELVNLLQRLADMPSQIVSNKEVLEKLVEIIVSYEDAYNRSQILLNQVLDYLDDISKEKNALKLGD